MKVGIFFGGQSREREISFAGGRTVYDNLDKSLFEAIPVFVDSLGNFILLDWEYVYKGTIRDFYPPTTAQANSTKNFQLYIEHLGTLDSKEQQAIINQVGRKVSPDEFKNLFNFAFLALHGPYGEDGNLQGLLEWYGIPYSGSGILPSSIGIDKIAQRRILEQNGFDGPKHQTLTRSHWISMKEKAPYFEQLKKELGLPFVIKAPHQGSSIGVSVLQQDNFDAFKEAVTRSLFIKTISLQDWKQLVEKEKIQTISQLIDIREGIGLPAYCDNQLIEHPEHLLSFLDEKASAGEIQCELTPLDTEEEILLESFIDGKEFSCIVIQDEKGNPIALPPTEIIKRNQLFDYRSKYLAGMSRKVTPIDLPHKQIEDIRKECSRLFKVLNCNVYARIDGFITLNGQIFLNDPNTTSGMLPSAFFFHQAAEIGLNPSQFLTYIIRTSLNERIKTGKRNFELRKKLQQLDQEILSLGKKETTKKKVAVIMGGFSSERHISVESGRNIYEKLSSSTKYEPIPIFLSGSLENHDLFILPVNIMLKDNADDINEKILTYKERNQHPVIEEIRKETLDITHKYAGQDLLDLRQINYKELSELVDCVFIALHGRPGEDGAIQQELEKYHLPYNGSGISSSQLTINKFKTNELLKAHGIQVAMHRLVQQSEWEANPDKVIMEIENNFTYPFITKPADDGCSSAVKKIKNRDELKAFATLMFRNTEQLSHEETQVLKLKHNEEFPIKSYFLLEELIEKGKEANHFLEITGGLLTQRNKEGKIQYEIFEPSETLATGEVLSLEEKFLAGEGQNITPARFSKDSNSQNHISQQVRSELEKVAKILNIEGYARIDAFVRIFEDGRAETIIIEINSLPGMTPATCIFHQSAINGYKPFEFIDAILEYGSTKELSKA
ncbi:D-alanine--D-alanine ligase family protein [Xanthovirga aplysinae]|uniref:D-alanine--D-alanine ligase family protein n=1 Tax=Xanthovirga aplysinae TaxID=2529853 RepID=UPI0012BC0741|nr:D-alanine--D-alanine ligase [Xanthovirga aplysinae]MTI33450.1 D-alanine--D-alanine ligase [Xanthovirga aplysinae]